MSFHIIKHILKAKKARYCSETAKPINVGDPYVRLTGVNDGELYTVAMIPEIEEMFNRINSELWRDDHEGLNLGTLGDCLADRLECHEHDQDIKDAELFVSLLPPERKHYIRERLEAAKQRKAIFMLTDTPITNAAVKDGWSGNVEAVDPEVSRALERKLNYAKDLLTKCRQSTLPFDLRAKLTNFFNLP